MKPNMKVRRVIAHATHHRISLHSVKISGFQPKLLYAVAYVAAVRLPTRGIFSLPGGHALSTILPDGEAGRHSSPTVISSLLLQTSFGFIFDHFNIRKSPRALLARQHIKRAVACDIRTY